jgi:NAD(P)-dependent dehydrogenase (short-subunit alcohol dehydrogenase family)
MNLDQYFGLAGKVVLLTGATRGIGLAMAKVFADAGASLVLASNEVDEVHSLAAELPQAIAVPTDVTDRTQLAALVDAAEQHFGGIDVLLCNAGIPGPFGPMAEVSEEELEALFAHPFNCPTWLRRASPRAAAAA